MLDLDDGSAVPRGGREAHGNQQGDRRLLWGEADLIKSGDGAAAKERGGEEEERLA